VTVGAGVRTGQQRHVVEVIRQHGAGLVAAYEAGASVADLATRAGVSCPTIRAFLKAEGVALRDDRGRYRKRRPDEE
jgi:predicted transcriptional regulator